LWIGRADVDSPMEAIRTPSGKIEVHIPELVHQAQSLDAASEAEDLKLPAEFPLILNAGRHTQYNANTLMRNPAWNRDKRACTVAVNPEDARTLGLVDGQQVRVTTAAGSEVGELQVSEQVRKGTVLIPHGFGLIYGDKPYGINVNRLTKGANRDPIGTPLHRFVPCRIEGLEDAD
jgi:anaerobic selenocysteine-containing dehydrogenase